MNVGVLVCPHIGASMAIGRQEKWEQAVSRGEGAELRQHDCARYMAKCPRTVYLAETVLFRLHSLQPQCKIIAKDNISSGQLEYFTKNWAKVCEAPDSARQGDTTRSSTNIVTK